MRLWTLYAIRLNSNQSLLLQVEYKSYYQWVPFVLFLQACLFYTPHALFKQAEGGKVTFISRISVSSQGCRNHLRVARTGRSVARG